MHEAELGLLNSEGNLFFLSDHHLLFSKARHSFNKHFLGKYHSPARGKRYEPGMVSTETRELLGETDT